MGFERIMAIDVADETAYQKYRDAMTPLLHAIGGDFGYDFKIAEVLKSKTSDHINRVFTIDFPSEQVMDAFFSSSEYLAIKARYFNNAVASTTVIAMHQK